MKTLVAILAGLALLPAAAQAQLPGERPPRSNPPGLPLSSTLYDAWLARALPLEELRERVVRGFIDVDDARRVHVELIGPEGGAAISEALLRAFGGVSGGRHRNRLDARVPLENVVALARALPAGHRLQRASKPRLLDVVGEGPASMGSAAWRDGGAAGAGLTVGIIDSDFAGLDMAVANGDLGEWKSVNYTGQPLQDEDVHGTACAEVVFDHAPQAKFRLYKIDSATQLGLAVDDCIAQGVDVISHSMAWDGEYWFDDEGPAADAAEAAAAAGLLFFTAAGNEAEAHWQGGFQAATPSSGWHGWVPGDRFLRVTLAPDATATFVLTWDDSAAGTDDYDLFLYDMAGSTALASSTNSHEFFEGVAWKNPSKTDPVQINVSVWLDAGPGAEFEIFSDDNVSAWEHVTAASSTSAPSNCTHPNVISVGAVHGIYYPSPPGTTGIAAPYSSHGPTNGGEIRPHLVAPTDTTTFSYSGAFGGTSCATPNAAGLALCLWSSVPSYSPNAIRWLVLRHGSAFYDWGPNGFDNLYGNGGANLIDFAPSTRWLTNEYGNPNGLSTHPANTLAHALAQTPSGGRIVAFPGGDFPAPHYLDQPVTLVSRGAGALFGD